MPSNDTQINWTMSRKLSERNSQSNGNKYDVVSGAISAAGGENAAKAYLGGEEALLPNQHIEVTTRDYGERYDKEPEKNRKGLYVPSAGRSQELAAHLSKGNEYLWTKETNRNVYLMVPEDEVETYKRDMEGLLAERKINLLSWSAKDYRNNEPITGFGITRRAAQIHAEAEAQKKGSNNKQRDDALIMVDDQVGPNEEVEKGYGTDEGESAMLKKFQGKTKRTDQIQMRDMYYGVGQGSNDRLAVTPKKKYTKTVKGKGRPPEQVVVAGTDIAYNPRAYGGGEDAEMAMRAEAHLDPKSPYKILKKPMDSNRSELLKYSNSEGKPVIWKRQPLDTMSTGDESRAETVRLKGPGQRLNANKKETIWLNGQEMSLLTASVNLKTEAEREDANATVDAALLMDRAKANMLTATTAWYRGNEEKRRSEAYLHIESEQQQGVVQPKIKRGREENEQLEPVERGGDSSKNGVKRRKANKRH